MLSRISLTCDRDLGTVFVSTVAAQEAALVEGVTIVPVETLAALVGHLRGDAPIPAARPLAFTEADEAPPAADFSAVRGQEHVKRALEVAAAGGHHEDVVQSIAHREGQPFTLDVAVPVREDRTCREHAR